eukprot:6062244-Alexandrium_andersonii.AAC.1
MVTTNQAGGRTGGAFRRVPGGWSPPGKLHPHRPANDVQEQRYKCAASHCQYFAAVSSSFLRSLSGG